MKIYWKSGGELTDLEGAIAENDGVVFWQLLHHPAVTAALQ